MRVVLNRNFKWSEYGGYKCYRIELQKFPNKWFVSSERILVSGQKHQIQFQPRQKDGDNKTQQESQTKNWLSGSGRNQGQWGRALEPVSSTIENWPAASPNFRFLISHIWLLSQNQAMIWALLLLLVYRLER